MIDSSLPGGAVALLVDLIRPQFCADEELAHRLPEVDSILPVWSPQRRPVLAWLSLSWRLEKLLADDPEGASDPTLPALITGTRLLAIETQLRTQALERWSLLDPGARHEILKSPPRFEPSSLLHRAQDTGEIEAFPGDNVRFLFQKLSDATTHNSTRFDALAGVTPLGWAVILGRLVDAIPTDVMPCESPEWFKSLSKLLQTTLDLDEDMPWGGFAPVLAAWDVQVLPRVFGDLARLDMDAGVRVNSEQGPHFKLLPHRRGVVDVSIPKGTVQLETWKFTWVGVPGEPHSGTESFRVANDDRLWFRWSETWLDERLLSVGVLQPQMASLAGVPSGEVVSTIVPPLTLPPELPPVEKNYVVAQTVSPASIEVVAPEPVAGVDAPLSVPPATPPVHLENPKPNAKPKSSPIDLFRKLEELQDANWSRRDRKALRHARIAFCQWQVDESYTHPVFEACLSQGDEALRALASSARKKPEVWNTYEFHESCAEHRRRRLLTAVLRACKKFAVDILLLPEYSIRADTALWLKENIAALSPTTSIWAGTYRVAAGSVLTVFGNPQPPAWSAVLPVILPPVSPGGTTTAQPRAKIYPAVAVDELFHPGSLFKAMFEPNSPNFDARSYIWELICSELFLVTSPSNLLAMAHARGVLMQQFGIPMKTEKELVDDLKSHIGIIAASTSLSQSMMPPRLIHLIPAMTRRTVDYFLSGQANFLAAGITTVFCNAVHQKYSKGQSCIIGHYGWGRDTTDQTGVPRPGPYHGLRPGVYIPFTRNDGPLGEFEQALVIADIDPVYSMEGSPRPQMLPPPLSLVAHLPIIESWELPNKNSKGNLCVCCGSPDRMPRVQEVVLKLLDSIDAAGSISKSHEDTNPDLLRTSLNLLADLDGRPDSWLHRRAEAYVREHSATPTGWPPPCALDWLWVNYGVHTEVKFPQIEMPAYSNAPKL